jgi:thiamine pyrophosphate-dependent acetolactate synthase large subunit-like protein
MGYTMIEIQTAVSHKLPVVFVVLDNGAWGAEKSYQEEFFGGRLLGAEIDSRRFDQFAVLCGARGLWVNGPGELGSALKRSHC